VRDLRAVAPFVGAVAVGAVGAVTRSSATSERNFCASAL